MSDITGDAITIHAAEKIEDAIEHVGYTSSQQQVGKAIKLKLDAIGDDFNARGAVKADKNTTKAEFLGVVKAVTSEAVPLVEGIAAKIAFFLSLGIVKGVLISSNFFSGYS